MKIVACAVFESGRGRGWMRKGWRRVGFVDVPLFLMIKLRSLALENVGMGLEVGRFAVMSRGTNQ